MDKKITIVTMFVTIILTLALLAGGIFLSRHLTAHAENNNIQEELPHEPDIQEPIYYGTWLLDNPDATGIMIIDSKGFGFSDAVSDNNGNYILSQEYTYPGLELTETVNGDEIILIEEFLIYNTKTDTINYGGMELTRIEEEKILITEATHFHTFSEWKVSIAPTCTEKGEEQRECKCSDDVSSTQVREIPALGHTFSEWVVITPATCTEKGIEEHRCTCGYSNGETREIPALTHDWTYDFDESRQPSPPICGETWEKPYICTRCGELKTEICGPLEHQYSDGQCVRCGEYEYSWPDLDQLRFISVETSKIMLFSRQNDSADGRPVYIIMIWETTIDEENKTCKYGNISCTIQITGKNAPNELRADFDVDRSDLFPEMYWINGTINIPENPQYEGTYIEYNSWKEN